MLASLGHPCKFQRVSLLGSVTARYSSSGRQPNFAALNRGRHLYSAGRPSRWALAHISSLFYLFFDLSATDCIFSVNKIILNIISQVCSSKNPERIHWRRIRGMEPQCRNTADSSFEQQQLNAFEARLDSGAVISVLLCVTVLSSPSHELQT